MVMLVAGQAHFEHGGNHLAAQVDAAVDGGDGEIAALGTRTVRHVAAFIIATAVDRQFDVVERVEAAVVAEAELPVVEQIGRASCRERGCPYVEISVVVVSLKKHKTTKILHTQYI